MCIRDRTSPEDFFAHMRAIRDIIGKDRSLHIQVISKDCQSMVKEAHRILEEIDRQVYIKVPVSYEGIKAIKMLKEENIHVTATAVYDLMQAYMALAAGADYICLLYTSYYEDLNLWFQYNDQWIL